MRVGLVLLEVLAQQSAPRPASPASPWIERPVLTAQAFFFAALMGSGSAQVLFVSRQTREVPAQEYVPLVDSCHELEDLRPLVARSAQRCPRPGRRHRRRPSRSTGGGESRQRAIWSPGELDCLSVDIRAWKPRSRALLPRSSFATPLPSSGFQRCRWRCQTLSRWLISGRVNRMLCGETMATGCQPSGFRFCFHALRRHPAAGIRVRRAGTRRRLMSCGESRSVDVRLLSRTAGSVPISTT